MEDWNLLGAPLIIALIPVLIALGKATLSERVAEKLKPVYPLAATVLGPALDYGLAFVTGRQADPTWGVAYGLAAVGFREIIDQWRKRMALRLGTPKMFLAGLLALLLAGCGAAGTYTGLLVSGETMLATVNSYNHVATTVYFPNCVPVAAAGFETFCPKFKVFSDKFDRAAQPAYQTWQAAVAANDTAKAKGAEATVIQLSTELAAIAAGLILQQGGR